MTRGIDLPTRQLVSQDDAALNARTRIPRSKFHNTWRRKAAYHTGYIYPLLVDEIMPGDHMRYKITPYLRMATALFPILDSQRVDVHLFFVPMRLLWDRFPKFMGEQTNPGDTIAYTVPQLVSPAGGFAIGQLEDHMGLPTVGQITAGQTISVNVLPMRAYNLIYNLWFRDQNLINSLTMQTDDGPDSLASYAIRVRAKSHDYFTSALPWAQKFTAPTIPVAGLAPVSGIGASNQGTNVGPLSVWETDGTNPSYANYKMAWAPGGLNDDKLYVETTAAPTALPQIYADLAQATGVNVNAFRQAFMVQTLLENDARGGTRYTEILKQHFDVNSPDQRLQRPEYIGGGSSPLNVTPIAQTAPTDDAPLGALGGAGTSIGHATASYASVEHGYILGLISVKSELSYQQGIPRLFRKFTRYDFPWPELAQLGEQAILREEIYATGVDADDNTVFGYQERYHEYRTRYSDVVGIMRSTAAGTLDAWHLAQRFTLPPTLSEAFIRDLAPVTRVLAAGDLADGQQYIADIQYERMATRPLPTFGTPAALGRF